MQDGVWVMRSHGRSLTPLSLLLPSIQEILCDSVG